MVGHSGIGTQVSSILGVLTRKKTVDLTLLGDPGKLTEHLPGFQGKVIPWTAPIYSLAEQLRPPPIPDGHIAHFPHYSAPILRVNRGVVCVHDLIHLQSPEFKLHHRLYALFMLQGVLRRARRIVTVSDTTRAELIKRFPFAAGRTVTIHNGLDHKRYRKPTASTLGKFRSRYGLPKDYLLTVGIGKQHKNIDFVMRALLPLWRDGKLKTPLVMGGTGGELPPYVRAVIEPGYDRTLEDFVHLLPYIDESEMPALYGGARLLIYPSLLEGFGFPMVEAMACGTPVLSSDRASLPEVGGDAAVYFNPEDQKEFIERLTGLLKAPARLKKLAAAGLKRSKEFDWESHVDALIETYRKILL